MRTGDLTGLLGISDTTIYDWVRRYEDFFSSVAKGTQTKKRQYTEEDILVLATIAKLYNTGFTHVQILEKLQSGERVEHPGIANFGVDTRMVPAAAVEQIVDSTQLRVELEQVKTERDKLLELITHERLEKREQIEKKDTQIAQLTTTLLETQRLLGRLEGRLEEIERHEKYRNITN